MSDYLVIENAHQAHWKKRRELLAANKPKMEYKYFCLSRPPSLDMGDRRIEQETWSPPKPKGGKLIHGFIIYPEKLSFEYIHKNSLLPADLKEQAEMEFWLEPEEVRRDYLAANPKRLHEFRYRDSKAWAALILLDLI